MQEGSKLTLQFSEGIEHFFKGDYFISHLSVESAEGLELQSVMRCMYTYIVEVAVMLSAL